MALSFLGSHAQGSHRNRDKYLLKTKGQTQNVFVGLGIEGRIVPPSRVTKVQYTMYNLPASQTLNFHSKLMTRQFFSAFSDQVSTNRSSPKP